MYIDDWNETKVSVRKLKCDKEWEHEQFTLETNVYLSN